MSSFFNFFKKSQSQSPSLKQTREIIAEPYVANRNGYIHGIPDSDESGVGITTTGHIHQSSITLIPGEIYLVYRSDNQDNIFGKYKYVGTKNQSGKKRVYFMEGEEEVDISENELGMKYKFDDLPKGGKRVRKTIKKRRNRKTIKKRRNRKTKVKK